MSGIVSKGTKKRIEGAIGLGKIVIGKNPLAHAVITVKETADSAHKLLYGKDPKYLPSPLKRFRATPKRFRPQPRRKPQVVRKSERLERLFEEDPIKRAIREARARGDYRAVYALKRLSR